MNQYRDNNNQLIHNKAITYDNRIKVWKERQEFEFFSLSQNLPWVSKFTSDWNKNVTYDGVNFEP